MPVYGGLNLTRKKSQKNQKHANVTRAFLFLAAIFLGVTAGLVRIGQGEHFPSDIYLAVVFLVMNAALFYGVIGRPWNGQR